MKKIAICFILVTIFNVTGCNNKKYTQDYDNTEVNSEISTQFPNFTFDNNEGQYYMSYGTAAAENGYYYVTRPELSSENMEFIYYYDMTSQTSVPLCSNLQCKHNDSSCDAFVSDDKCLGGMIWYHSGRIYMIERTQEKDSLVSYDKEGRNKENECVLSDGKEILGFKGGISGAACMSGDYLYFVLSDLDSATDGHCEVKVYRKKLKDNSKAEELEKSMINTDQGGSNSFNFRPIDDKVYIFTIQDSAYTIFEYDIANNRFDTLMNIKITDITEICRGKIISSKVIDREQNVYFVSSIEGEKIDKVSKRTNILNKYNTVTKENEELYVLEGSETEFVSMGSLKLSCYDGKYIYFYENTQNMTTLDSRNNIVIMNTDGSIVDKIHFDVNKEFMDKYYTKWSNLDVDINIIGGDERYLMITTSQNNIKGIEVSDENMVIINNAPKNRRIFPNTVAVFNKNQIGTGEHIWIKVK